MCDQLYGTTSCRHASLHEKMFLKAVLAEFRRTGLEEATFKGVHQQLDAIYKTEGEFLPVAARLRQGGFHPKHTKHPLYVSTVGYAVRMRKG